MDLQHVRERLELLRREYDRRLVLRGQVAQQLAQLDRELEQRRGGIAELELLTQRDEERADA